MSVKSVNREELASSISRLGSYGLIASGVLDQLLDQAGSAISVASDMFFTTTVERDAYFAENPDKLVDKACVVVAGQLEQYDATAGKFDNITSVITGPKGDGVIFQYSATGSTGWTPTLDTAVHKYWRWSTDGGTTFSPNGVQFIGSSSAILASKFGWFNYDNSVRTQVVEGGTWTTLMNNALGNETYVQYSPPEIDRMLDPVTGRILLDQLAVGDEVFIRHTANVIPNANNTTYAFSHYFGDGPTAYRLPIGTPTGLDDGAGVPTGDFLVDTHFFIKDDETRMKGMLPQVFVSNTSTVEYTGCYISVNRR